MFTLNLSAQVARPKLIVGLVVDQMRWDYLYYYYDEYGKGRLKRLLNEGFSCDNTMINYVPTVTAIGHSSIFTGSVPAFTGIAGNNFYIKNKYVYCCDDTAVTSVGSNSNEGKMSPRNMFASTIGDELKIATDFKSKVIGVALKDRAAILPAGHSADAAYWWDTSAGHFITSSYYMKELPEWVNSFNRDNHCKPGFNIKGSNEGVCVTFKMAKAAIKNENLGKDGITDFLTVSISSTDIIGHAHGTRGAENHDVYMRLDKDLADFLNMLDETVGKGNYLLFLTADHGAAHNHNFMKKHKIPANGWNSGKRMNEWNHVLNEKFGADNLIVRVNEYKVYLNHKLIKSKGLDIDKVKAALTDIIREDDAVINAVDYAKISQSSVPELIRERIINGYNAKRSGDIYIIMRAQYFDSPEDIAYKGTSHGQWNPYDSHIPLVFMGWHIQHGKTATPVKMVDIAPTICDLIHIQMPNSCIGNTINEITNR